MSLNTQKIGIQVDKRVEEILKTIGISNYSTASKELIILAIGRLLSVKITDIRKPVSVHELTKEIRRSLELVLRSPLGTNVEEAIVSAIYTNPPFDSDVLNTAYRVLLDKLLRETVNLASKLSPMWRRRLINITVENIYNIAVARETFEYRKKIFETLERFRGGKEGE